MKLTKQGIRDLNTRATNGRKRCLHNFNGPWIEIGQELLPDDLGYLRYEPIYGKCCMWCGETRR